MTPDRCGTGRDLSSLTPGDRKAVEDFTAFLSGELAYDKAADRYVDPSKADGHRVVMAGGGPKQRSREETTDG